MSNQTDMQKPNYASAAQADRGMSSASRLARIGERLGFYRALHTLGSLTPDELAKVTRTAERYAHDWLHEGVALGFVSFCPRTHRFSLNREQAETFSGAIADSRN